jgi:hypothetical protein
MRPKIFMWWDYGAPTQKHWRSPSRRSTRSSIGPKILVVAGGVVAGVIGISGIYPQIIDADWVQSAGTDSPHSKNVAISDATTTRRSGIVAAIPLPPRRVAMTTGDAVASEPRAAPPPPATAEPPKVRTSIAGAELSEAAPLGDIPDAQAMADPPTERASAATPEVEPSERYVARAPIRYVARTPVVKKRVVRTEHHRGSSSAYAQYGGGWGGGWGGWNGWPSMGSLYHF